MARTARRKVIKVPLFKARVNLSELIKRASKNEVVVTVDGRPAAVIIGFEDEDDWRDYRLLQDERFLGRVAEKERFVGDSKVDQLLTREYRSPFAVAEKV